MRDIPGYEGLYRIDVTGRIWSIASGRFRRLQTNPQTGYFVIVLSKKGVKKQFLVHRLVAATYLGPCPKGQEVRHKDGTRNNPRLDNLEYGTRSDNIADTDRHGRLRRGENSPVVKLTAAQVLTLRAAKRGEIGRTALKFGVTRKHATQVRAWPRICWAHI